MRFPRCSFVNPRALRRLAAASTVAVTITTVGVVGLPATAVSPDVVISQVYGGGGNSGAPFNADFIELFNGGTTVVSLDGMSVQYASATGSGNFTATALSGSIGPGEYRLVQEASGANGAPLPAPDVTGTIAMAATAGKVALVNQPSALACNGASAPCSGGQLALIRDLVGYGTANFYEGAGAAPVLSNTTAALRNGGGATDTDNNRADFTATAPVPRNGSTAPPVTFTRTNPRPVAPPPVGGNIKVASFNTLNYFTTLGSDNPNARGADTAAEFARQQAKEVEAIVGLDADVYGLMEVENNGATARASLVDALNAATAPGTYAFITPPVLNAPNEFGGTFGTDAIQVAIIYRPAVLTPVGDAQSPADPIHNRPPLVQTFRPTAGGGGGRLQGATARNAAGAGSRCAGQRHRSRG